MNLPTVQSHKCPRLSWVKVKSLDPIRAGGENPLPIKGSKHEGSNLAGMSNHKTIPSGYQTNLRVELERLVEHDGK